MSLTEYLALADRLAAQRDAKVDEAVAALYEIIRRSRRELLADFGELADRKSAPLSSAAVIEGYADIDVRSRAFTQSVIFLVDSYEVEMFEQGEKFTPILVTSLQLERALRVREADVEIDELRLGDVVRVSPEQVRAARELRLEYIAAVGEVFRRKLRQLLARTNAGRLGIGELLSGVKSLLAAEPARQQMGEVANQAERVVRTELLRSFTLAQDAQDAALATQVRGMRKMWRSARDPRVRTTHVSADARYSEGGNPGPIPANQYFQVGSDRMQSPRLGTVASENVNCRCIRLAYHPRWFR